MTLVVLALLVQGVAWSRGRNEGRPLGCLPIYRATPQQAILDRWVKEHAGEDRTLVFTGYPPAWDVKTSVIKLDRIDLLSRFRSVTYDEQLALARGGRLDLRGFDVVLLNPSSRGFDRAWGDLPATRRIEYRDAHLAIVRLGG